MIQQERYNKYKNYVTIYFYITLLSFTENGTAVFSYICYLLSLFFCFNGFTASNYSAISCYYLLPI